MPASSPEARRGRSFAQGLLRWALKLVKIAVVVFLAIYLSAAFNARGKPDLARWHTVSLASEFRARDAGPETRFSDYLEREARVFEELQREVYDVVGESPETLFSRYQAEGPTNPSRLAKNWNRSFQLAPAAAPSTGNSAGSWPRGAALLIHGLTDSPYSLRRAAEILQEEGYHVVGLRLPGHGTNPGSLATISWLDWRAAVRVAARHVDALAGDGKFLIVGYSAGGALSVDYAIRSLLHDEADGEFARPDRLVLFSPAIGITRFAALASWHKALSWMDYFEKFRWSDIEPEYDPFKYNSFPLNAGEQMHRLALAVQESLRDLDRSGRMGEMPDILAFQSLIDSTVLTDAITADLFDDLERAGSELVLFDLNRVAPLRPFLAAHLTGRDMLDRVETDSSRRYVLTVITNVDEMTQSVAAKRYAPGTSEHSSLPLGTEWPGGVYSLSHVAMPFPPDDPLYGGVASESPLRQLKLGTMAPRGEKGLLRVSVSNLMRLRFNPFFGYVEQRLRAWID